MKEQSFSHLPDRGWEKIKEETPLEEKASMEPESAEGVSTERTVSLWDALKRRAMHVTLAVALLAGTGMKAEAASRGEFFPNKPVAAEVGKLDFRGKVAAMDRAYASGFEQSLEETNRVLRMIEEIHAAAEFSTLDVRDRAEITHREAFSKLTYNKHWFEQGYKNFSVTQAEALHLNFQEIAQLFYEAITMESQSSAVRELRPERERSVVGLIDTGRAMAHVGVRMGEDRPDLSVTARQMLQESNTPVEQAMAIDGRMRAAGNGLYVFSDDKKLEVARNIIGLAKFAGDLPQDISVEKAAGHIGGAHYEVGSQVVPWANAVVENRFASTPAERAFIDALVKEGVLLRVGNQFSAGSIDGVTFTTPNKMTFTHEMAHEVQESYLPKATQEYERLNLGDKNLFDAFMTKQNPGLSKENKMKEFFAYTRQATDWRDYAKKIVGR